MKVAMIGTMKKVVLLRHGESTWNRENGFTGWVDVSLREKGIEDPCSKPQSRFHRDSTVRNAATL